MASFPSFSRLPSELRVVIWNMVLHQETQQRLVVLHDLRVMPFKHLISPLLSVNYEGRQCARAFYDVKLDIYEVPPSQFDPHFGPRHGSPNMPDNIGEWNDETESNPPDDSSNNYSEDIGVSEGDSPDSSSDSHSEEIGSYERLQLDVLDTIDNIEVTGTKKGAIFISPAFDTFVIGIDCVQQFCFEKTCELVGRPLADWELPWYHISASMSPEACRAVQRLALLENMEDVGDPWIFEAAETVRLQICEYEEHHVDRLWRRGTFEGVRVHEHLWLWSDAGFMSEVDRAGGRGSSHDFRRWVWRTRTRGESKERMLVDVERYLEQLEMIRAEKENHSYYGSLRPQWMSQTQML